MFESFKAQSKLIQKILAIILPFGKRELAFVGILVLLQGTIQVMGIFSIMPFLALATNPETALESKLGQKLIEVIPFLTLDNIVFVAGILTVILLVTSSLINGITDFLKARYAQFTCMHIGTHLLTSYANQPYIFHLNHNSAELMKRLLGEVNFFMTGVLMPSLEMIARLINVALMLIVVFAVNPIAGVAAFFVLGSFLSITLLGFQKVLSRGNQERKYLIGERFLSAQQLLRGIKTINIHECQQYFISRFYNAYSRIAQLESSLVAISNSPRYVIEAITFSSIVIIVLTLKLQNIALEEVLPFLAFFVLAAYRIMPSLQIIYGQLTQIQSKKFAVNTLYQDLVQIKKSEQFNDKRISDDWHAMQLQNAIVFSDISFAYPRAKHMALKNINLEIQKGQRVGIVGSSGSGKSTLIDILIGLLNPSSGKILIDECELTPQRYAQWHRLVGYVAQDIFLTDDIVRRNIAFGIGDRYITEKNAISAAKIAQIHDYIETELPHGYDTSCGEGGVRLSGGQRQRIALARALYHQPSVLVFDEATSALDNETERKLIAEIEDLPDDLTIIMVAHRLSTVKNCDVIYVMNQGEIIESGTYEELNSNSITFQQLAGNVK